MTAAPILEASGLGKSYARSRGWLRTLAPRRAFHDVDLRLTAGSIIGLVGASGAGKSSLGRCLSLMEPPDRGTLTYRGRDVTKLDRTGTQAFRGDVQLLFQDAAGSFNPRWSARSTLEEPLRISAALDPNDRRLRADELARRVGLGTVDLDRSVLDFSGGQLKRLNLARALALEPSVLILDEPFAGLDVSLQAQLANLLLDIQRRHRLACLLISHDLAMVSHLADELVVLDGGRVVEHGATSEVLDRPTHPSTRRLIAASTHAAAASGS